nr:twin-arginine translocation signal domain-containing protein [Siphonobacter sp. SORGH_AS_1065]
MQQNRRSFLRNLGLAAAATLPAADLWGGNPGAKAFLRNFASRVVFTPSSAIQKNRQS